MLVFLMVLDSIKNMAELQLIGMNDAKDNVMIKENTK